MTRVFRSTRAGSSDRTSGKAILSWPPHRPFHLGHWAIASNSLLGAPLGPSRSSLLGCFRTASSLGQLVILVIIVRMKALVGFRVWDIRHFREAFYRNKKLLCEFCCFCSAKNRRRGKKYGNSSPSRTEKLTWIKKQLFLLVPLLGWSLYTCEQ